MKLIALIFGLIIGFGGGIWWGVHHPTQAASLSAEEERKFLEVQVKASEAIKHKLDELASKQLTGPSGGVPGSGFVSGNAPSSATDADINSLRDQQDQLLQQLNQRLGQLKQ